MPDPDPPWLPDWTYLIEEKWKVLLEFYSESDEENLIRYVIPLDFAVSRPYRDPNRRLTCIDMYDEFEPHHILVIRPTAVVGFVGIGQHFEPAIYVTWDTKKRPFTIPRDWGFYS